MAAILRRCVGNAAPEQRRTAQAVRPLRLKSFQSAREVRFKTRFKAHSQAPSSTPFPRIARVESLRKKLAQSVCSRRFAPGAAPALPMGLGIFLNVTLPLRRQ
ncbi:hypothetical protein GCM10027093_35970 [Paraburkholderia jirisanensis]